MKMVISRETIDNTLSMKHRWKTVITIDRKDKQRLNTKLSCNNADNQLHLVTS